MPAALGVMIGKPEFRPVVIGDGAFQMTGMELSTIVRHGFSPVVIVLDNGGYGTERLLHEGEHEFNDVHRRHYHKLPDVLGGGTGYDVHTEHEFDSALTAALADTAAMSLSQVHLEPTDCSKALRRLCSRLSKRV